MIKAGGSVRQGLQARRWLASVTLALCLDAAALGLAGALLGLSAAPMAAGMAARPALRVRLNPAVPVPPVTASRPPAQAVPPRQPAGTRPASAERPAAPELPAAVDEPAPPVQSEAAATSPVQTVAAAEPVAEEGPGSPGDAATGAGGQDTLSGDAAGQETLLRQLDALIRGNLVYPPLARARNIQGEVRVSLLIGPDGGLVTSSVASGSGSSMLDKAAISLVRGIFPVHLDHELAGPVSVVVRIVYALTP